MIRRIALVAALAVTFGGTACGDSGGSKSTATSSSQTTVTPGATIPIAQLQAGASTITDQLIAHKWQEVVAKFNAEMRAGLSADGLKTAWAQVETEYGVYKSRSTTARVHVDDASVVTFDTPLVFAKANAKSRILFDANGEVANLYILRADVP